MFLQRIIELLFFLEIRKVQRANKHAELSVQALFNLHPSKFATASRSCSSSCRVPNIRVRLKSSIFKPCTI